MKAAIRFSGGSNGRVSTYMGETFMETIEVSLGSQPFKVALYPAGSLYVYDPRKSDPVGGETRAEFGHRLRRAASDAARQVERSILEALREQGHLV